MALGAMGVIAYLPLAAGGARAQTHTSPDPAPLVAARALFGEALVAEEAGRFAEALEKFERVRAVRDTASIEYRIGSCHEGLGELALAFRAYLAAQALGRSDPEAADVWRAASDRLDVLAKRVARLTLAMPSPTPDDAEVQIDGSVVASVASLPLAPGRHVVSATADGATPFRSEIALAEGAEVTLTVVLDPRPTAPAGPPPPEKASPPAAAPFIALGGGAVFLAASAVLVIAREGDIADLESRVSGRPLPGGGGRERPRIDAPPRPGRGARGRLVRRHGDRPGGHRRLLVLEDAPRRRGGVHARRRAPRCHRGRRPGLVGRAAMTRIALVLSGALCAGVCACEDVPTLTFAQADASPDAALDAADTDAPAIEASIEGGCSAPRSAQNPFACCGSVACEGLCDGECDACASKCTSPGDFCCAKNNNVICRSGGSTCP